VTLFVCSWLWGEKWPSVYVERLFAGVGRNLRRDFRSVLITDQVGYAGADIVCQIEPADRPLLAVQGCLVRMRMFDPVWQAKIGARKGDRIVCIDVDAVITGGLDPLFDRDDEFTIMQGFNQTNPCPFNGSLWMFRAGERHDVWTDFDLDAHRKYNVPVHFIADDQGWLHFKFPHAKAYTPRDGVYAFKKIGWGEAGGAVFRTTRASSHFPDAIPESYPDLIWIRQHWLGVPAC
jgi:hypothetical protein